MPTELPNGLDQKALTKLLLKFSHDDLIELTANFEEISEARAKLGPQTKQELWLHFKEKYNVELSRVSVCAGHSCQLDMVWEVYSFLVKNVLWVVDRGGGKTSTVAWMDDTQCEFFPGFENFTIGPGRSQGDRKYAHILPYVIEGGVIGGKEMDHIARSTLTETQYKNGSKIEIALGGTPEAANGPRVPRLHRDEIELLDPKTRKQAGGIPAGRNSRDGRYMPAQIVDTSTMKWAGGYVDESIQEYNESIELGRIPRQEVRISCIFESSAENPTCRSAPEAERRARLIELGRDPSEICNCDKYVHGVIPNEDPDALPEDRTLEWVCQGRFFRSRGYKGFDDVILAFNDAEAEVWDAERECSQPARDGAYLKAYNQLRSGIKNYEPRPEYGAIYTSVDWGGSDEHSFGWYQWLEMDVRVTMWKSGSERIIPSGSVVRFAEIFKTQIGDIELGKLVIAQEDKFMLEYPGWNVKERYCDMAGLSQRLNWRDQLGLDTLSRVKKEFNPEVAMVRALVGSRYFFIDIPACPWGDKALRAWRQINGHEVHDFASHPMAEMRYLESNRQVHVRKTARQNKIEEAGQGPQAASDESRRPGDRQQEQIQRVSVTYHGDGFKLPADRQREAEVFGDVGAVDSPLVGAGGRVRMDTPDRHGMDRRV